MPRTGTAAVPAGSGVSGGAAVPAGDVVAAPGTLLADWLLRAVHEDTRLQPRLLRLPDGSLLPLDVERWAGPVTAADQVLLSRAEGPVLDVGCGPGRLTAALHRDGVAVLGVDVLPEVPVLARRAGAPVLVADVLGPLPGAGSWRTVLLADGNVGIGGDPVRLLRRLRGLLAGGGTLLVELHPGSGAAGEVRLECLGAASAWFPWALVGPDDVAPVAAAAGLSVSEEWTAGGRAFAALRPS